MLKYKLFTIYIFLQTAFCGCSSETRRDEFEVRRNDYKIAQVGKMKKEEVTESSGIEIAETEGFWTHGDGGTKNELYRVNISGNLLQTITIDSTKNKDWEALAKNDEEGILYIGDFGNNNNKRQDLRIFRVNEKSGKLIDTIRFRYRDQHMFPPPKPQRNFDCEAFFYYAGNLYLFTKNRGKTEWVKVYKVPAKAGDYEVNPSDSIRIESMITAADISPDGKQVALMGYGKIFVIAFNPDRNVFDGKKYCIPIGKSGQAEGLVYLNNNDLLFTNEGGKLFKVQKK